MTVEDALEATARTNALGMSVSVDNLGENVTNIEEARESEKLYHELIDALVCERGVVLAPTRDKVAALLG